MIESILKGFEFWTSAQGVKSKSRTKTIDNISLEGIARLRELILELAIRGRLIPQQIDDEPASGLLSRIENIKIEQLKNKELKKQPDLPVVSDHEKTFEIPQNWVWTRLGNICFQITDGTHYTPKYVDEGIPFISVKDVSSGEIDFSDTKFISNQEHKKLIERCRPEKGDLLLTKVGTTGIPVLIKTDKPFSIFVSIALIKFAKEVIDGEYLSMLLRSPLVKLQSEKGTEGIGNKNLVLRKIWQFKIVIPPLEEQKRIVAKVNELMALCDKLEQKQTTNLATHHQLVKCLLETLTNAADTHELQANWQKLSSHFDTLFCTEDSIEQLKETILQLAIMGRLLEQDPKDEPANELVKRLQREKEKLSEEGKLKNQNILPEVKDHEKPFQIPDNWVWVRLGNITNKIGSGSTPRGGNNSYVSSGILFLRSQNIRNEGLLLDDVVYIDKETNEKMSNTVVLPNDILLNITGGSLGRCAIFPSETKIANVSQHVTIIRPTAPDSTLYLHNCILSPYIQGLIWGRQIGANREGLSKRILEQFEIPYPPIEEQKRIVVKVKELISICDKLSIRIIESQEKQTLLSTAIIENVIA